MSRSDARLVGDDSPYQIRVPPARLRRCQSARSVLSGGSPIFVKAIRNIDLGSFFKVTTRERFDWITPVCLLLLCTFGVFFIYSAQLAVGRKEWLSQVQWIGVGAVVYTAVSLLDYRLWLRWSHWVYLASLFLLILVLIPGIGVARMGARR